MGTLGVSLDQVSNAVRSHLGIDPTAPVNIMFGVVEGKDRSLRVGFEAHAAGQTVTGNVTFQILEANSRMWAGTAILLDGRVDFN